MDLEKGPDDVVWIEGGLEPVGVITPPGGPEVPEPVQVPQIDVQSSPEQVLRAALEAAGSPLDALPLCTAGCGKSVLRRAVYRSLSKELQKELQRRQIRRVESRGICGGCYLRVTRNGELAEYTLPALNAPIEERVDIPPIWESVREAGGGYGELGERLGISYEYARQVIIRLGLPRLDRRRRVAEEREYFLSELDQLVSFGLGIHQIAQAFSLSDDQLVEKVGALRDRGLTEHRFDSYLEVAA